MSVTTPDMASSDAAGEGLTPPGRWKHGLAAAERTLVALVERANPILVKETRQALKSRQFVVTFLVVLIACWIVSITGVAIVGPEIYYAAAGGDMLLAYFTVLAFPLAVIVPFTAFRSLAAEQEDNTYDLLSITTLGSKQIITGKLLSACVQIAVYLSAVSPCIAFTFLLRGVDALTIAFLIVIAVLGSLGLSMIALFIGAAARVRYMQMVISVGLILGLTYTFAGAVAIAQGITSWGTGFLRDEQFWMFAAGLMTLYLTTFGLLHSAAAAQIAFTSENRSTPLRWWMMAQQACFCGWLAGIGYTEGNGALAIVVCVAVGVGAAYWYAMGTLLTSEWPHLSRRVQRSLPQSAVGRTYLSFFNPGPGSGYLFCVANLTTLAIAGMVLALLYEGGGGFLGISVETTLYFVVLAWSYVVAFLGFGRLIINFLRRWAFVSMAAGFLVHVILLLTGVGVPTIIQMTSRELRQSGYTLLQMTNPFWTLGKLVDDGPASVYAEVLIFVLPPVAMLALLLNMRSVAAELMRHRVATPLRIVEEEAALHPLPAPKPSSPWEMEDDGDSGG